MSGYAITLILVGLTAIRELVTIKMILSGLESKTNAPRPQESLGTAFEERRGIGYERDRRPQPFSTKEEFDAWRMTRANN